jgi:hypothetical protein
MSDFKVLRMRNDNGGVHINSGIPNYAFYLIATELGGYSWERAGKIYQKNRFFDGDDDNVNWVSMSALKSGIEHWMAGQDRQWMTAAVLWCEKLVKG